MKLGNMYASKIENEKYYEKIVYDTDITGRSVFKIITSNQYEPLMDRNDTKANSTMLKLWNGQEAYKCDGKLEGYSSIFNILKSENKSKIANKGWFYDLISSSH